MVKKQTEQQWYPSISVRRSCIAHATRVSIGLPNHLLTSRQTCRWHPKRSATRRYAETTKLTKKLNILNLPFKFCVVQSKLPNHHYMPICLICQVFVGFMRILPPGTTFPCRIMSSALFSTVVWITPSIACAPDCSLYPC